MLLLVKHLWPKLCFFSSILAKKWQSIKKLLFCTENGHLILLSERKWQFSVESLCSKTSFIMLGTHSHTKSFLLVNAVFTSKCSFTSKFLLVK